MSKLAWRVLALAFVMVALGAGYWGIKGIERLAQERDRNPGDSSTSISEFEPDEVVKQVRTFFAGEGEGKVPREPEGGAIESIEVGLEKFPPITDDAMPELSVQTRDTLRLRYNQGVVAHQRGDTAGAIAAFRSVHEIDAQGEYGRQAYIQLGVILDREGRHDEAIRVLKNAADLDDRDAVAAHNLGLAYLHKGDTARGIEWMEKASSIDGANVGILQNLGNAHAKAGSVDKAVSTYKEALKIAPKSPAIHYNLGLQLYLRGDAYEEAQEHFEAAAGGFAGVMKGKAWAFAGLAQFHRGFFSEAARCFAEASAAAPGSVDYRFNRAVALTKSGLREEAAKVFEEVVKVAPTDAQAWFGLGGALYLVEKRDAALEAYLSGLRIDSAASGPLFAIGYIYLEKERYDLAESAFRRIVENGGAEAARAQVNIGYIHEKRGDLDAAAEAYRLGDMTDPRTHYNLGLVLRRLGDSAGAVKALQEALRLNPREALYSAALADAHLGTGNLDAAISSYEQAIKSGGERFGILIRLAQLSLKRENIEAARKWNERALAVASTNAEKANAHLSVAILQGRLGGDIDAAVSSLEEARRFDDANPGVHYNLGLLLARQTRWDEAVASLQTAIRLKPDYAEAYTQLGNIYYKRGLEDEAAAAYARAVQIDSRQIDAAFNLRAARTVEP